MTGAVSIQAVGIIVAVILGLVNLAWQVITWRTVRGDRKRAAVSAHIERPPLRLILSNAGPEIAREVSAAVVGHIGSRPRYPSTWSSRHPVDLAAGDSLAAVGFDYQELSDAAKVRLQWKDGHGSHDEVLTLNVPH